MIDKKFWRANWDEQQQKQIYALARSYMQNGQTRDLRSAWRAAEENFADRLDPHFRKAMRRG